MYSIFWFGFSADPPTLAHRKIVKTLEKLQGKKIIVVFAAGPLRYKKFGASKKHRFAMIQEWWKASNFGKNVMLSFFDFRRKHAWIWYQLWKKLTKIAPQIRHCFVVGSDQYSEIRKSWEQGCKFFENAHILIVPRKGFYAEPKNPRHALLRVQPIKESSTNVRKGNLSMLDSLVRRYIIKHRIYDS